MYKCILILIFFISLIMSQPMHSHTHIHNIELGGAIGIVPNHEEEGNSNIGIHLHFIKGFGVQALKCSNDRNC